MRKLKRREVKLTVQSHVARRQRCLQTAAPEPAAPVHHIHTTAPGGSFRQSEKLRDRWWDSRQGDGVLRGSRATSAARPLRDDMPSRLEWKEGTAWIPWGKGLHAEPATQDATSSQLSPSLHAGPLARRSPKGYDVICTFGDLPRSWAASRKRSTVMGNAGRGLGRRNAKTLY